jgi:chitodextrinase
VVRRSLSIPALVLLLLLLGASNAQAAEYRIAPHQPSAVTGDQVTFQAERENPGQGVQTLRWDFGDGSSVTTTAMTVTKVYTEPETYVVTLSLAKPDDTTDPQDETTITVTQKPNAAPSASFSFTPSSPMAGEPVSFAGGSDPDGDSVTRLWDFGDGTAGADPTPSHTYANAGDYTVTLTVTDEHGESRAAFQTVTVSAPPLLGGAAPTTGPVVGSDPLGDPVPPLVRMRPFPVVRIAGVVLPRGARVQILSVRAPRGSRIRVRCLGRGCPVGSMTTTSAARVVRLHRFERRLRAGIRLELFVRRGDRIGKYTRFLIRAGAPPKRVDLCLFPTRRTPGRCP